MSELSIAIVLAWVGVSVACSSQLPPDHPCSEESPSYRAHVAACIARVQLECADVPDNECPAVAECDRYFDEVCR